LWKKKTRWKNRVIYREKESGRLDIQRRERRRMKKKGKGGKKVRKKV
jgi:hypothetical protein